MQYNSLRDVGALMAPRGDSRDRYYETSPVSLLRRLRRKNVTRVTTLAIPPWRQREPARSHQLPSSRLGLDAQVVDQEVGMIGDQRIAPEPLRQASLLRQLVRGMHHEELGL